MLRIAFITAMIGSGCGVWSWGKLAYYDTFRAQKYPWIVFELEITGTGIGPPRFLELWVEASDLRHLEKQGSSPPENRLYLSASGGIDLPAEGGGTHPSVVGEMTLVLSEIFLNRTEFPCRLELGRDVVKWNYQESIFEVDAIRTVTFFSDVPGSMEITVTRRTFARDTREFRKRTDLDYAAFGEFEGSMAATFMTDAALGRKLGKQEIRRIRGTFRQVWRKEYREEGERK